MAMRRKIGSVYEFGAFRVDEAQRQVTRDGQTIPMPPKVFDALLVFVENSGQVLEKEDLLRELWPDSFVEESNLSQTIFHLRKALGEKASHHRYIETVPRRGYRFVAEVKKFSPAAQEEVHWRNGTGAFKKSIDQIAETPPPQAASYDETTRGRKRDFLAAGLLVVAIAAVTLALYFFMMTGEPLQPFQKMKITRLTSHGRILYAVVSPDGKYIAHVTADGGKQSLRVRQAITTSDIEIIPPALQHF